MNGGSVTVSDVSNSFFKAKCLNVSIGITTDGVHNRYSSKCHMHGKDDHECDVRLNGQYKQCKHPIIDEIGPVYYQVQSLRCDTHGKYQNVDVFDPEFELSEHDHWFQETEEFLSNVGGGLVKYGHYIYTWRGFTFIWNRFVNSKKVGGVRKDLIEAWKRSLLSKFNKDEYDQLCDIFDCDGIDEVLGCMIDAVLPAFQTLAGLCKDFGFRIAVPIQTRLSKAFARLASRFWVWDGTHRIGKGIIIFCGGKTKYVLLCFKDEWGNYVAWELVPAEKHKFIIPIAARLTYGSLMYGPYREDVQSFLFASDNAFAQKSIPRKVFKFIQKEYNNGNRYLQNEAGDHVYDLYKLAKTAKMAQDTLHSSNCMDRDGVLTKNDPVKPLATRDYQHIMRAVNEPSKPIILNGKRTALTWYFGTFRERYSNWSRRMDLEVSMSRLYYKLLEHRRAYLTDIGTKNASIDSVINMEGFAKCMDLLREIVAIVHRSQWPTLLSRWMWWNGTVNDDWMMPSVRKLIKVYNSQKDFENDHYYYVWVSTQILPASVIETLLAILRVPDTTVYNYGYQDVEHFKDAKESWWTFYECPRFIGRQDRERLRLGPAVIDLSKDLVSTRKRICFEEERLQYEYNNCVMKTAGEGSTGVEGLNANVNYYYMQKGQRTIVHAYMQQVVLFVCYNKVHYPVLIIICPTITKEIKQELQECYTEINLNYAFLRNKARPRNNFIKFKKGTDYVKKWMKEYIKQKQLPATVVLTTKWTAIHRSILLHWLVLEVKRDKLKFDTTTTNKRTLLPQYQTARFNDSDSDSDNEVVNDMKPEKLTQAQREAERDVIAHLVHAQDKRFRRGKIASLPGVCRANVSDSKAIANIKKELSVNNITYWQFQPVKLEQVEFARTQIFESRFKQNTICSEINNLFFKVER